MFHYISIRRLWKPATSRVGWCRKSSGLRLVGLAKQLNNTVRIMWAYSTIGVTHQSRCDSSGRISCSVVEEYLPNTRLQSVLGHCTCQKGSRRLFRHAPLLVLIVSLFFWCSVTIVCCIARMTVIIGKLLDYRWIYYEIHALPFIAI